MEGKEKEDVYCTLVMDDGYLPGAAVLAKSLRDAGTQKKLACMIVQDRLRPSTITELQSLYNHVIPVPPFASPNIAALYLMRRPDLQFTFTKIHLWRLTQFRRIVYVDADVVALRAPDELFDIREDFAAAPDIGFPDIFNSGVLSLAPDAGVYEALRTMASTGDSFDGADQGLLNQYFEHKPWKRLSFTYNCTPNASYQYEPAYKYYKRDISMVHFIGSEKPWQKDRSSTGTSGVYQELLNRWWAVYDRHFKLSTSDYIYGRGEPASRAIHNQLAGNAVRDRPLPATQARKFSAPHAEWDATRGAPPIESRPEAANFPTTTYEFSTNPLPFRPPGSYPEPPTDLSYQVPAPVARSAEKLAPIFPWEEREASKPTRFFAEDEAPFIPPLLAVSEPEEEFAGADELEVRSSDPGEGSSAAAAAAAASRAPADAPWELFEAHNKNAWDDVSGIENYVRALSAHQKTRGQVQAVPSAAQASTEQQHILSPTNEPDPEDLIQKVQKRRESLILTDFPTAIERPSLPVTPAPVRRSTFWGGERQGEDQLPPAEGVPSQEEWNPAVQLEQLRRSSLIGVTDLKMPDPKVIPDRKMPQTASTTEGPLSPTSVDEGSKGLGVSLPSTTEATDTSRGKGVSFQ